ncbi:MAG: tRNA (guanosine(37)-N1)-methyltransferase TrmD [Treponema sp.]|jgi:tRNA (guanine37-N1)-methyltransferase|nr:tRNA (guanosine(37)-N1)-methyltransferase TrmD [Treponema sp.]
MKYTVLSLFPKLIDSFFSLSIPAKAVTRGIIEYQCVNIRDFALDKHKVCDDAPFGGGAGMLMKSEPLGRALESVNVFGKGGTKTVVYLSPAGKVFNQTIAAELAQKKELVLICGHYEGIDQRIIDVFVDQELSIGDYVLSSGETAALVVIDATFRLVETVIKSESLCEESFQNGLLEYPQYTRPEFYKSRAVPQVLMSGHHEHIRTWRLKKRVEKTLTVRPDLIERGTFDGEVQTFIKEIKNERNKND